MKKSMWLEVAKSLTVGEKTRIDCACGPGKTRIVSRSAKGFSSWCFRCSETPDFVSAGPLTLKELAALHAADATSEHLQKTRLPEDFTKNIPLVGRLWLYKAGITPEAAEKEGWGFSESASRVVLPIYNNDQLVWWQMRAVYPGHKPKYLSPRGDRKAVMYKKDPRNTRLKRTVVITEDILSAYRVGRLVPARSLLGTSITTEQAAELSGFATVILWMDGDKGGAKGRDSIKKTLSLVTQVKTLTTEKDPKGYAYAEIKRLVESTVHTTCK